ncbi:MAG TPA: regulatory protein RecX [Ktedonobacterales bacterium]|nr:regulatory protein RecX [Ktedonobacterales bacterium]
MKITSIEPQAHQSDRYSLFLDGRFALGLDGAVVVAAGLAVGMELSEDELAHLRSDDGARRLLDAALRFLAPRPRSRAEVRRRLLAPRRNREPADPEAVERTLDRLESLGVLDDAQFAAFWVENREQFSPRSARAMGQELRLRGVSRETVEAAADPEQDEARALAAARQRLRAVARAEYPEFRTKLGQFLLRRGFNYETARVTVRQLWEETHGSQATDDEGVDASANPELDVGGASEEE